MWYKLKRIMMRPNGEEKQVRPDTWWQPWANTMLYLPMEDDFIDATWNNTMSNSGATIVDLNWVKCGYFNYNRLTCSASPSNKKDITMSVWINYSSWYWIIWSNHSNISSWDCFNLNNNGKISYWCYTGSRPTIQYATTLATNTWLHVCKSWDKIYLNWIQVAQNSSIADFVQGYSYTIWQQNSGANSYIWYMSKLIVEDKARTAQEIADYYNNTKNIYWIS